METSILTSTKKLLNIAADYTVFDLDIITFINSVFSTLNQLGLGPLDGFMIENSNETWDDYDVPMKQKNLVKSYLYMKVRLQFDPPQTSFGITAIEEQIKEDEWRLNSFREDDIPLPEEVDVEL